MSAERMQLRDGSPSHVPGEYGDKVATESWPLVSLGQLLSFSNGVNAKKKAYGRGIPFVNVLEVITHSHLCRQDIPGRVNIPKQMIEAFSVTHGDILFNRTSETDAEVGLAACYVDHEPVVFGGFVIRGRPKSRAFDPQYAGYALRASFVRKQVIAKGQGAVRANIGQESLRQVVVPIPGCSEQRAIAEALSDVDVLLGALDALIAKKRAIQQAAMQQLLTGKTRLCEFALRTSYVDSDLGQIPADWKCCAFGEVVDLLTGFPFPSSQYAASGVLLVRGSNVKRGSLDWAPDITEYWAATTSDLVRYQLSAGDLVIAMDGALVGRSYAMISDADVPSLLLQRVARLRSATVDQRLLLYWVASDAFSNYVDSVKTHTAIPHISAEDIRRFRIVIPTNPAEQSAIATVLSDMDAEITALEARRDKTRAIKQGMMQQLLTGRVRLIEPDACESQVG